MSLSDFRENENTDQNDSIDLAAALRANQDSPETIENNRDNSTVLSISEGDSSEQYSRSVILKERAAAAMDRVMNSHTQPPLKIASNVSTPRRSEFTVIDLGPAIPDQGTSSGKGDCGEDTSQVPKNTRYTWKNAAPSNDVPVENVEYYGALNPVASIDREAVNFQSLPNETLYTEADIGECPITMYILGFMLALFGPLALIPFIFIKKRRNQKYYLCGLLSLFVIVSAIFYNAKATYNGHIKRV